MVTRTIYCPICGRKVMTYDLRVKNTLHAKCKKCKKVVAINTITGKIYIDEHCERTTASGMRFF